MSIVTHTTSLVEGTTPNDPSALTAGFLTVANLGAAGPVATVPVATAGTGYNTIPTVAFSSGGATATAVMKVLSATVAAGGTGGTTGTQTVTGTTGTGTKFQASVTVAGGAITAVLSISVAGAYTVMPTLAGEPVTGASLTGATLNIVTGVASITVGSGGSYTSVPTASLTGGTAATAATLGTPTVTWAVGTAVTTTVTALTNLPPTYVVNVTPSQDAVAYVTNRVAGVSFDVVLNPRLAANSVAPGTFDVQVLG